MHKIDNTIYNMRPRPSQALLAAQTTGSAVISGMQTPGGGQTWGPRMWRIVDKEMDLRGCSIYCYSPEEDPFDADGEEGAIWSLHYFLFNKARKRVCYIYLRALSALSHPMIDEYVPMTPTPKRKASTRSVDSVSMGASKRARYWLGDRIDGQEVESGWGEEDDEMGLGMLYAEEDHDPTPVPTTSRLRRLSESCGTKNQPVVVVDGTDDESGKGSSSDTDDEIMHVERQKRSVRALSEEIAESMEV